MVLQQEPQAAENKQTPSRKTLRLRQLWDVSSVRPQDGNVLIFTQADGKWVPAPGNFAPLEHDHDIRYYTRAEMDNDFAPIEHNHRHYTGGPDELIPSDIGAANDVHSHDYAATNHIHSNATTSADGFMSEEDKSKLNGIEEGADVSPSPTSATPTQLFDINPNSGTPGTSLFYARSNHKHPSPGTATSARDGWMSMFDKDKLDGIEAGATAGSVNPYFGSPTVLTTSFTSSSGGTSNQYARGDHRHGHPGLATPFQDGWMSREDKAKLDSL